MKNKELFDRANQDTDLKLQEKLRKDYATSCEKNGRNALNPQSTISCVMDAVNW